MSLGDIVVQRELSNAEAKSAIATLFGLAGEDVLVVNDLTELLAVAGKQRVLCHKWDLSNGCFHAVLSFHEGEWMDLPRMPTAVKLSALLHSDCLVSDQTDNPYSMVLITPTGTSQAVKLNACRLDNNEYEIVDPEQPGRELTRETHEIPG